MTTGQKCLANLLQLTNAATSSIVKPQINKKSEDESHDMIGNQERRGSGDCEQSSCYEDCTPTVKGGKFDAKKRMKCSSKLAEKSTKQASSRALERPSAQSSENSSGRLYFLHEDSKVEIIMAKSKENGQERNHSSDSTNMSSSSNDVKTPPKPSDQLKSGVFVSDVNQALEHISENPLILSSKPCHTLMQGDVNTNQVNPVVSGNEVVAISFPEGQKKGVLHEKFKARMLNNGPVKKTVMPKIIHDSTKPQIDKSTDDTRTGDPQKNNQVSSNAETAVSFASIATSAAIAPFLQIQTALESQIASLVNSISLAQSAKEQVDNSNRENQLEEFKRRMARLEELQTKALKHQVTTVTRTKELDPQRATIGSLNDMMSFARHPAQTHTSIEDLQMIPTRDKGLILDNEKLPCQNSTGGINFKHQLKNINDSMRFGNSNVNTAFDQEKNIANSVQFETVDSTGFHGYKHIEHRQNATESVKPYGVVDRELYSQRQNITEPAQIDGRAEIEPNRQNIKKSVQFDDVHGKTNKSEMQKITNSRELNMLPVQRMPTNARNIQEKYLANEYRRQKLYSDKSTSPFLRELMREAKNSKTQTSSAESSLLSEQSLLETPLPRSKIPVPFSRYTPKGDKRSQRVGKLGGKRLVSRSGRRGGNDSSKHQVVNRNITEKENLSPNPSSNRRFLNERSHHNLEQNLDSTGQDTHNKNLEIMRDEMTDIQKETVRIKEQLKTIEAEKPLMNLMKSTNFGFDKETAPLDNYLVFPIGRKIPHSNKFDNAVKEGLSKEKDGTLESKAQSSKGHHIEASRILEEIQRSRSRLENNLETLVRHRDQSRLYDFIDQQQSDGVEDAQRIRLNVDKRIEEIGFQVKQELQSSAKALQSKPPGEMPSKIKNGKKLLTSERDKTTKSKATTTRSTNSVKSKTRSGNKEKSKKKAEAEKPKEPDAQPLSKLLQQPSYLDEELFARIYGKPTHNAHRSSIRPPHIQFHSPQKTSKQQPRANPAPLIGQSEANHVASRAIKQASGSKQPMAQHQTENTSKNDHIAGKDKAKYYFQPSDVRLAYEQKETGYPSTGELVPIAVSLGKPRQDTNFRLPIPSEQVALEATVPRVEKCSNVAVVEICADDMRKEKEERTSNKKQNLIIQNLPNVDIQTPEQAPISRTPENRFILQEIRHSSPKSPEISPVLPPEQEEYSNFQNYIATNEMKINEEEEADDRIEEDRGLHFDGLDNSGPKQYNEPPFPPQQPHYGNEPCAAEIQTRLTVEEKAQEWIEQELLARIISQMNAPKDPTLTVPPVDRSIDGEPSSICSNEDEYNWIHDMIGPSGLQLFVDAGLPINNEIVSNLVRDVIAERIKILLGHPKSSISPMQVKVNKERPASPPLPSHVSTPIQTPIYTPIQSEASSIRTPPMSTISPDSSEENVFSMQENKDEDLRNNVLQQSRRNSVMPTPPQTPLSTRNFSPFQEHADTPLPSVKEEVHEKERSRASTPEVSLMQESLKTQSEFELSGSLIETVTEEETPPPSLPPSRPLQTPPRPIVNVIKKPPSPNSFTISSTTTATVGSSLFEGISEGEHLYPDSVIPGLYSEGEFPVSEGQAILSPVEELDQDEDPNFKQLLKNIIGKTQGKKVGKTSFNGTATLRDTEELDQDTLEEISISEGEFLARDDPMTQLLNKIKSPPDAQGRGLGFHQEKSEGEVSVGEQDKIKSEAKKPSSGRLTVNQTRELKRKDLSADEIAMTNNDGRLPSFSVEDVGDLSLADLTRASKPETFSNTEQRSSTADRITGRYDEQAFRRQQDAYNLEFIRPGEGRAESKEAVDSEAVAFSKDSLENTRDRPRAIFVQSRDFDNASSFNFTDSLNDTKFGTLRDSVLGTLNEQQIEEAIEGVEEADSDHSNSHHHGSSYQKIDEERMPTKITLMIPSVADEDSEDEVTLEGDVNSYEDEATFSG